MCPTIGFTGDVMLGRLVDQHRRGGRPEAVWGDLTSRLRDLDGLFINLECAIAAGGTRWERTERAFHFRAHPDWAIDALTDVGVDWVTLANNHALDYEVAALEETLEHLERADIAAGGAGRDETEACAPRLVTVDDLTVGLLALTDNTSEYAATTDSPGTCFAPIGEPARRRVRRRLELLEERSPDLIVASLHWGPNMTTEPNEARRAFGRWLVEQGVDVVHGHSAHVFHGVEVIDGRPIMYDTGDFVDDYAVDPTLRNDHSFLFELTVTDTGTPTQVDLVPTVIRDLAVHRATGRDAEWCRSTMRSRSAAFDTAFDRVDGILRIELSDG
ncbi:MAG: CapA family protein [Halobacteriota archaeon]